MSIFDLPDGIQPEAFNLSVTTFVCLQAVLLLPLHAFSLFFLISIVLAT
jgi:hypothetical protein